MYIYIYIYQFLFFFIYVTIDISFPAPAAPLLPPFFQAGCCGEFFPCRKCHNAAMEAAGPAAPCTEEMDRAKVTAVQCNRCGNVQAVAAACTKCHLQFARYTCLPCRMFDETDKGQFHCNGCGICRIGGQQNYTHCNRCGVCYVNAKYVNHTCALGRLERNCTVCLEDLHSATEQLYEPRCGHVLHFKCYAQLRQAHRTTCPTCSRSFEDSVLRWQLMDAQIAQTPLPHEDSNKFVLISCNDCTVQFWYYFILSKKQKTRTTVGCSRQKKNPFRGPQKCSLKGSIV